jgi:hypothetical protein
MARATIACLVLLGPVFAAAPTAARSDPNLLVCTLQRSGSEFKGSCEVPCRVNELAVNIDGANAQVTCDAPPRRVAATLRETAQGKNWIGTMEGRQPEDPTRFEIVSGRNGAAGIARTPFGWFALQSAQLDAHALSLTIFVGKQLPPTADDIRIIRRASELVSSVETWNKNDTRACPPNPQRWSVFCALMQATEEISGGIHYRQPALQAVREVLNEVGGNRVNKHRLMDYNNHPDTTLQDIHNLLGMAQSRLEKRSSEK